MRISQLCCQVQSELIVILDDSIAQKYFLDSILFVHSLCHYLVNTWIDLFSHVFNQQNVTFREASLEFHLESENIFVFLICRFDYFCNCAQLTYSTTFEHFLKPTVCLELWVNEHRPPWAFHCEDSVVDADLIAR